MKDEFENAIKIHSVATDFDEWNKIKKSINDSLVSPDKFPQEAEVWLSYFGLNIGFEQNGSGRYFSRPVVVIKKINNKMFFVIPLSTKQKDLSFYYNFTDNTGFPVSAILSQLKLVSIKRFQRKMYKMDMEHFGNIKKLLIEIIT